MGDIPDTDHQALLGVLGKYSDRDRDVMTQAINLFISTATKSELAQIRRRLVLRAKSLRNSGKKGRPRAADDHKLMAEAREIAWRHIVRGEGWEFIARNKSLWPTRQKKTLDHVIRTLQRKEEAFAAELYRALPPDIAIEICRGRPETLSKLVLSSACGRVGLPFRQFPEECRKVVLGLVQLGGEIDTTEAFRSIEYIQKKRKK